jgi:S1-C subfamily serine protease
MRKIPPPTGVRTPMPSPATRSTAVRGFRPFLAVALIAAFVLAGTAAEAASLKEGRQYYVANEYDKAFVEIEPLAEDGEAQAQYILGVMYLKGQYVTTDSTSAAQWFRKAADQGHAISQINLAILYARGDGIERSLDEAYFWSRLARRQLTGRQGDAAARMSSSLGRAIGPARRSEAEARIAGWQPMLRPPKEQFGEPEKLIRFGTGFFVSASGTLLTNEHVISGCDRIVVRHDGRTGRGTVETVDFLADIAVVRSDLEPAGIAKILKGPRPPKDTAVIFFGYAPQRSRSRTPLRSDGVIVDPDQHEGISAWMQTSAQAYSGQSGSALLDSAGRVIGVVRAVAVDKERAARGDIEGGPAIAAGIDTVLALLTRAQVEFTYANDFDEAVPLPTRPPFVAQLECWVY